MNTVLLISRVLDLIVAGSIAYERIAEMKARVDAMKAEGREPTEAEWAELFASIAADSAALAAAAREA